MFTMINVLSLDGLWWRADIAGRFAVVGPDSLLCRQYLGVEGSPITDAVAVSELSVLPLGQRAAVAKLRAAGSEGWTAAWPLDVVSSEGRSGAAPFSLPRTQQTSGSRTEEGDQQHHQQHGD